MLLLRRKYYAVRHKSLRKAYQTASPGDEFITGTAYRGYSTITSVRAVVKPAFQMAYDEDAVRKNPFVFKLKDAVVNDSVSRAADMVVIS